MSRLCVTTPEPHGLSYDSSVCHRVTEVENAPKRTVGKGFLTFNQAAHFVFNEPYNFWKDTIACTMLK